MLCSVGQRAAGPVDWGVHVLGCATGMLPNHVQTHSRDTPLTVKGRHDLSNLVPNRKAGSFCHHPKPDYSWCCDILKEQEKWETMEFRNTLKNSFLAACVNY